MWGVRRKPSHLAAAKVLDCRTGLLEDGQVIVEQAIILPAMVFLILGLVQLGMLQQARLMTEYAAFQAARAGAVYNGDRDKMQRAAFIALMPTYGRSDGWAEYVERAISEGIAQELVEETLGTRIVEVYPQHKDEILDAIRTYGRHLNRQQLDFDDYRDANGGFGPVQANRLSVRVRYLYTMRIPFANWFIQTLWFAQRAAYISQMTGPILINPEDRFTRTPALRQAEFRALGADIEDIFTIMAFRNLADCGGDWSREKWACRRILFPLNATYTVRMQSNYYRDFVEEWP